MFSKTTLDFYRNIITYYTIFYSYIPDVFMEELISL